MCEEDEGDVLLFLTGQEVKPFQSGDNAVDLSYVCVLKLPIWYMEGKQVLEAMRTDFNKMVASCTVQLAHTTQTVSQ